MTKIKENKISKLTISVTSKLVNSKELMLQKRAKDMKPPFSWECLPILGTV